MERIHAADVVAVSVGEGDPHDRGAQFPRCGQDLLRAAEQRGVDQRQPVLLGDQVGVDEAEARDSDDLGHRSRKGAAYSPQSLAFSCSRLSPYWRPGGPPGLWGPGRPPPPGGPSAAVSPATAGCAATWRPPGDAVSLAPGAPRPWWAVPTPADPRWATPLAPPPIPRGKGCAAAVDEQHGRHQDRRDQDPGGAEHQPGDPAQVHSLPRKLTIFPRKLAQ